MKRRAAFEPSISHLKQEHRMDGNQLKGMEGNRFNAILSAAGMNFRKLMKFIEGFFATTFLLALYPDLIIAKMAASTRCLEI